MTEEKGLTLLEVLITTAIAIIVGLLLFAVLINSAGIFYKENSRIGQGLSSNDALNLIRQEIKQSSGVVSSYQIDAATYTSGETQLVLKIPSIDSSENIITDTFDYFVFYQDQDKLRLKSEPNAQSSRKKQNQILALNVSKVLFQYFNNAYPPGEVAAASATKVRLTLSLKQKAGAGTEQNISTSEATLNND